MPVSSTRVKYTDRQAHILVKDFTTISDSSVQNVDPGTVIPEGVAGESLLQMLLRMLQSAINGKPFSFDDDTLLNFALRIINGLDTSVLGVYGQVIEKIRAGGLEVMGQFSTYLMKEISKRSPALIVNPTTAVYVDIIKATVESLMSDRDFVYLLLTPEAAVTYKNTVTTTPTTTITTPTTPVPPTTVVPVKIDYSHTYKPYTAQELATLRQTSSGNASNQLMSQYASQTTPVAISVDADVNGPSAIRVYLSVLKLFARHNTQHLVTPTYTSNAVADYDTYVNTVAGVVGDSYVPGYNPKNPMLFATMYKRVYDNAVGTALDVYNLCRFGVDNHYTDFHICSAVLNRCKERTADALDLAVKYEAATHAVIYVDSYLSECTSYGVSTLSTTVLDKTAFDAKAAKLAKDLIVNRPAGKTDAFILAEYRKSIKQDITASLKTLITTDGDRNKTDVRAKIVSYISGVYLCHMSEAALTKVTHTNMQDNLNELNVCLYILSQLFDTQYGYFYFTQDSDSADLSAVIGSRAKFIPYAVYPTKAVTGVAAEDFTSTQEVQIFKFLSHLITSGLFKRTSGLTNDWDILMYKNMIKARDTIIAFEDQYLHDMLRTANISMMTDLGISTDVRRLLTTALLLTSAEFPPPTGVNIDSYNSVDLSKVTYHASSGKITYTV